MGHPRNKHERFLIKRRKLLEGTKHRRGRLGGTYKHMRYAQIPNRIITKRFIGYGFSPSTYVEYFKVVYWEDGEIHCGSRNRELSLDNDNAGFMRYIMDNKEKYEDFFNVYPNAVLYGEWLVKNRIKDYIDTAWRRFYVFDIVLRDKKEYLEMPVVEKVCSEFLIDYIPYKAIPYPTGIELEALAKQEKFLMKPGYVGEGIVIHRPGFVNKYGRTAWAKIVNEEFKTKLKEPVARNCIEVDFVEQCCTEAFIRKEFAKLQPWNNKMVPRLLSTVYHEFVTEELWDFIKKHKNPKIDFSLVNQLVANKVKSTLTEVF